MVRIVLDTNLWISYLISDRLIQLDQLFEDNQIQLLFSRQQIVEFTNVARRPKFQKYFSSEKIVWLLDSFEVYGEEVEVTTEVTACRDVKDNFLLALAQDGSADYLVTGDEDLLVLGKFGSTEIVRYSDFIKTL